MDERPWVPEADDDSIHAALMRLRAEQGALDAELARWMVAACRARIHRRFGMASFAEYAERLIGYDPHTTKEKLRVGQALEGLPKVRALLASGARSWSAVREMTRTVVPETEEAWIDATEGRTVREVERLVAGRRPGDLPSDPKDPLLMTRRLVFELPPEDFAVVADAFERIRAQIGEAASNVEVLRAMAAQILAPDPAASDAPHYQVALTVCAGCQRTWHVAAGDPIEVPPEVGACARCDGEVVGIVAIDEGITDPPSHVGPEPEPELTAAERALLDAMNAVIETGGWKGLVHGAAKLFGGPLKSVTPRLRRLIRDRDQRRCVVPGCNHRAFIEVHHLTERARGGRHEPDNTVSLCSAHHGLLHHGLLAIHGTPSTGLRFTQAGGTLYGDLSRGLPPRPARAGREEAPRPG